MGLRKLRMKSIFVAAGLMIANTISAAAQSPYFDPKGFSVSKSMIIITNPDGNFGIYKDGILVTPLNRERPAAPTLPDEKFRPEFRRVDPFPSPPPPTQCTGVQCEHPNEPQPKPRAPPTDCTGSPACPNGFGILQTPDTMIYRNTINGRFKPTINQRDFSRTPLRDIGK